ncbi:response regulator transcription factor [Streptomyces luteolifulvus]|uniref:Response regulator transcription factor n=1 Tax=Streptomyces luteolifulvus TaxID=2615112 RepID=A0A6H9UUK7_9ACTN|nr:response regulator [Streptomyces luteolifulvus]KAB1142488.1 response regulator transcription factor [Streptomyces luteolifulvus]
MRTSRISDGSVTALLVVDDVRVREAMKDLLSAAAGFRLVAAVADPAEAVEQAARHAPHIGIVDLWSTAAQVSRGLNVVTALCQCGVAVLALTPRERVGALALEAGAAAFVDKGCGPDQVLEAARSVAGARSGVPTAPRGEIRADPA